MNAPITLAGHNTLPLATLAESPTNPRAAFPATELDDLVASIKAHGVIEPIIVRARESLQHGRQPYEIVCGARRYRAAKLAGLTEIPAIVRQYTDAEALQVQIIENLQRADITPLDEARAFDRLLTEAQLTREAIATQIGKSIEYVHARLKLLALAPAGIKALTAGTISAEHAVLVARLPAKDQQAGLEKAGNYTVRELRQWVQERDDSNKTQQRVQGEISKAKAADEKVVAVCDSAYDTPPKGTLKPGEFVPAGKAKCEHLARAFVVDDPWTGKGREWLYTGKSFPVCTKPATCTAHKPQKAAADQKERNLRRVSQTGRSLAEERRRKARASAEAAAIFMILQRVNSLGSPELDVVTGALLARVERDHLKTICRRHEWEPKKRQYGQPDHEATIREQYLKLSARERQGVLFELALQEHASLFGRDRGLVKIAKRYRVDIAKLERQALAAMKAKNKSAKKGATKPAKASTKTPASGKRKGGPRANR